MCKAAWTKMYGSKPYNKLPFILFLALILHLCVTYSAAPHNDREAAPVSVVPTTAPAPAMHPAR